MSEIQHAGAKQLLDIIADVGAHSGNLTYTSAAKRMRTHPRPVAHMCDLLDAAACLAGVPLLALVAVRAIDGEINPKAWAVYGDARSVIIERSQNHEFSRADFDDIGRTLTELRGLGLGNRKAWAHVRGIYRGDLFRRLIGEYSAPLHSALDDLGTEDPARVPYSGYTYLRDQKVRSEVLRRAAGKCEYCGAEGFRKADDSRYLETHHVIALANDGADKLTNVIALCPNDHRKAHFSADRESIEDEMLARLKALN